MNDDHNQCPHQHILAQSQENSPQQSNEMMECQHRKDNPTELSTKNFIKSLRSGLNNNFICIYQEQPFVVQLRFYEEGHQRPKISVSAVQDYGGELKEKQLLGDNLEAPDQIMAEIRLEMVPYDCVQFQPNLWMVSCKSMPPRIYRLNQPSCQIQHVASFHNKKKNSELYMSPIQISTHANRKGYALGGGRRFLCSYNLQKLADEQMYPSFDKANISAIHMLNQNSAVVGTFEGAIELVDLRQPKQMKSPNIMLRPHVDAVMSLASSDLSPHLFASSGRKDNFIYLWDIRLYGKENSSYVHELIQPRFGNQRISLAFSTRSNTLYTGSEQSQIVGWEYQQARTTRWKIENTGTINSVIFNHNYDSLIFSTGSRTYQEFRNHDDEDLIGKAGGQLSAKFNNYLGAIKLTSRQKQDQFCQ